MSFMFKPYPYDDTTALNHPKVAESVLKAVASGNDAVAKAIVKAASLKGANRVIAIDGYVGAEFANLVERVKKLMPEVEAIDVASVYKGSGELEAMLAESLPMDKDVDPVLLFGKLKHRPLETLFDAAKFAALKERLAKRCGAVLLFGHGASSFDLKELLDVIVFLDVAPINAALKIRNGRTGNIGDAKTRSVSYVFRRAYYYDYEILAEQRQRLMTDGALELYVDANKPDALKALPGKELMASLEALVAQPFRCKPVYIEGVWGGFFIKRLRELPSDMKNCAWVFDLIPNEVSVLMKLGSDTFEIPFPTLFRALPRKLMGEESFARFGRLFPIRFNYDDTYEGGGNMSVQVHPGRDYAKEHFGEPFQQDESYYVVATAGSRTYLGLQDDAKAEEFFDKIRLAETKHEAFDYQKYVNSFESKVGDQYMMPGGTLHASGWNQVVLEIGSCTVGSYTFKLYDYLRKDLDGNPRPIHSKHGMAVLNTERRRSSVDGVLRPVPKTVREGRGWKETLLGEHEEIFFSLRRLEFEREVFDDTKGKFHVLVLVEGDSVLVYSKADPTRRYKMNRCDMAVVPAELGEYGIMNLGESPCKVTKTLLK